jgi:hypothetical protein
MTVRPPEVCRKPAQVTTCQNREHNIDWRFARLIAENERVDNKTDTTDDSQTDTAMADTEYQACQ